jgi:Mor family transcriptional regulator
VSPRTFQTPLVYQHNQAVRTCRSVWLQLLSNVIKTGYRMLHEKIIKQILHERLHSLKVFCLYVYLTCQK